MRWSLFVALAVGCATAREPLRTTPESIDRPSTSELTPEPRPPSLGPEIRAQPLPATMPEPYRSAWEQILALGWPDPRAGSPHRIEIADSTVWSTETQTREVVGFVLPHRPDDAAFAVVGFTVYPVVQLGAEVDLAAACTQTRETTAALDADDSLHPMDQMEQTDAAWARCPVPAVTLRLAESDPELVEALGDPVSSDIPARLASYWMIGALHNAFERAVTAHMRADDAVARYEAHRVTRALPILRRALLAAGLDREVDRLRFLDVAAALAADQDRRADTTDRHTLPVIPSEGPVDGALVPALIAHLDEVQQIQGGQPGGVNLRASPVVDALARAGAAAVLPLIDVLEHDDRLTRSVHFWRDFVPNRTVLAVHEAAYAALVEILGASFFRPAATGDNLTSRGDDRRAALASRIRTYWERYGHGSSAEWRYGVLADDDADRAQQVEAALWLTNPEGGFAAEGSMVFVNWTGPANGPMAGETIRDDRDPSVTELLTRRLEQRTTGRGAFRQGCSFAAALSAWSPDHAVASITRFASRCVPNRACPCAAPLTALVGAANSSIIEAYTTRVRRIESLEAMDLAPIASFESHPSVQALVDWLFSAGPLSRSRLGPGSYDWNLGLLAESRTLELASIRARVADLLADEEVVAMFHRRESGGMVEYANGAFGVSGEDMTDTEHPVRRCDLAARSLSEPLSVAFSTGWPEARRAAAIAMMRDRLRGAR